jgi:hypothetical protein
MANAPDVAKEAAFLAAQIVKGRKGPSEQEVAEAVSEIEIETQTKGSSFIKLHMADPEWSIISSPLIERDSEGMLPAIQIEFPQGSKWEWTLAAAEPSNELSQPNLVLTFEDSIVHKLREYWGSKRSKPGINTRAEFIRELCVEAGVKYVIPSVEGARERENKILDALREELQVIEAFENSLTAAKEAGKTVLTPEGETTVKANAVKESGITAASKVTVKGAAATPNQIELINEVMGIAAHLKISQLACEALVVSCIVESRFGAEKGGLLQFEPATAKGAGVTIGNVSEEVSYTIQHGATGRGGFQQLAKLHPTYPAYRIAQEEQGSGAGAPTNGAANYGPWVAEARTIIAAYGGVKAVAGGAAASKQQEVARGTTANPDENSWDCMVRLAGDVNWSVFTNGRSLFYLSGPEMLKQRPVAYVYPKPSENKVVREDGRGRKVTETGVIQVPLNATFDNTSLEYFEDHKVKGKVQKRSRIGRPQSPSEIKANIVCEPAVYQGGQVAEVLVAGPLNGRWIITDATRAYLKDRFTQLIMEPPGFPYEETEEGKVAEQPTVGASLQAVSEQASKAWSEHEKYKYTEAIPARENNGTLFGPSPRYMDCSAFAELCYKAAGLKDPSGQNYHPIGNTGTLIAGMQKIGSETPGCLAFFGPSPTSTEHVVVCVGNGEAVGLEDPALNMLKGKTRELGASWQHFLGFFEPK